VPVSFFFDDLPRHGSPQTPEQRALRQLMERSATPLLLGFYYAIPDVQVREQFLKLVKAVAK
jgi:hypothetical protein